MNNSRYFRRRLRNGIFLGLSVVATVFGLGWLTVILGTLLYEGFTGIEPIVTVHKRFAAEVETLAILRRIK